MNPKHVQSALAVVSLFLILQGIVGAFVLPAMSASRESALFSPYGITNEELRTTLLTNYRKHTAIAKKTLLISSAVGLVACGLASLTIKPKK